ncbi:MAG: CHAT domain-containing protein [Bacteroidota bacterium]
MNWLKGLRTALWLAVIMSTTFTAHAQKWEKQLQKADNYYNTGAYAKADKTLVKFKKKVTKKLGASNKYMPGFYIRKAKLNLASGMLMAFDTELEQAVNVSQAVHGENTIQHSENLIEAAEIYVLYGHYLKANDYIEKAQQTLETSNQLNEEHSARIDLTKAAILSGSGFYKEALELMDDRFEYFAGRAVKKDVYVDESGALKSRKLSDQEVTKRLNDYANLFTLKAHTLMQQGDFDQADAQFEQARKWISKNVGKNSVAYVNNLLLHNQGLEENAGSLALKPLRDQITKDYQQALSAIKRKNESSHYVAFDIYESLLKNYLRNDENNRFKNLKVEYEAAIKKNFQKSSIHYVNLNTVDFDAKLDKEKTKNLEGKVVSILSGNVSIPKYHKKRIQLLEVLLDISMYNKEYAKAQGYLEDILEVKEGLYGNSSPEYHLTKLKVANFYLDFTDNIAEADKIYKKSFIDIVEKQIHFKHVDYTTIQNHMAALFESNDQYKKASEALQKSKNAAQLKFDREDARYGVVLEKIARLQIKIGEYSEATSTLDNALEILEEQKRNEEYVAYYVKALETHARFLAIKGLFDDAEYSLNRSQRMLKRAKTAGNLNELSSLEELASLYLYVGRYSDAEKLLIEVIGQYEKLYGVNSRRLIDPLVYEGSLKLTQGHYTEAEKIALRANDIALKIFGENSTKSAPTYILLAEIYGTIGDYGKAQENIGKALVSQEARFGRKHIEVAKAISQLALIKFYKGDDAPGIEKLMTEARDIVDVELGNRTPTYAEMLKNLSRVYIAQQKYDDAFNALELAENIWLSKTGRSNNINAASIYILTGDVYYYQRNYKKAEENYDKALKLYKKFFNDNHPEYVKVLTKLGRVHYMEGDSRAAKKLMEEALTKYDNRIKADFPAYSERQKTEFWNTIKEEFEFYNTLAFELKDDNPKMIGDVYNNALLTKALLLNSSIKIKERILNSKDEELIAKYVEWLEKKEALTNALSMSLEQLQENDIDPIVLEREAELLEKELSKQSELFKRSFDDKKITWSDVRSVLKKNEVAIEMVRYRHFDHVFTDSVVYAMLYVKNEKDYSRPQVILVNNGRELEQKYFKYYKNSIIYRVQDPYSYDAYWKPIYDQIGTNSTIYLSSDGVFNQINLEAIPTGENKYVIDNSNIVLVSNTKDIVLRSNASKDENKENRATMFGNPDFYLTASSDRVSPLPGTEREVKELNELLKQKGWISDEYLEGQASEEKVKALDNPKVFHIATHGFFTPSNQIEANVENVARQANSLNQSPLLRTGLMLTGAGDLLEKTSFNYNIESGILTAYEAMNLNLDQTDLVVLSACETGLGELTYGEGVYGLQRAFMVAGAKTLIMSMFKVDDEATQKLMVKFYRKWLETGKKRESFVEAKKEIRTEYPDPIYWGAFIMIGLD